jgi:hypothetical protein
LHTSVAQKFAKADFWSEDSPWFRLLERKLGNNFKLYYAFVFSEEDKETLVELERQLIREFQPLVNKRGKSSPEDWPQYFKDRFGDSKEGGW